MRCAYAILPAACLWGASFPLALSAVATRGSDPGRVVGGVYAANTLGAILGAVAFSIVLILAWHAGCPANPDRNLRLLSPADAAARAKDDRLARNRRGRRRHRRAHLDCQCRPLATCRLWPTAHANQSRRRASLCWRRNQLHRRRHTASRRRAQFSRRWKSRSLDRRRRHALCVRMLGHLPAIIHPNPKSILVVGCGMRASPPALSLSTRRSSKSPSAKSSRWSFITSPASSPTPIIPC